MQNIRVSQKVLNAVAHTMNLEKVYCENKIPALFHHHHGGEYVPIRAHHENHITQNIMVQKVTEATETGKEIFTFKDRKLPYGASWLNIGAVPTRQA